MTRRLTCVIPARLHSVRVPQKMIAPFAGSCLLEIALRKLLACPALSPERIYLSAYDPEIKEVGKRVGVQIYNRSLESTFEPLDPKAAWQFVNELPGDYFLIINACNPLLSVATLQRAVDYFEEHPEVPSLFSVIKKRNFFFDSDSRMISKFNGEEKYLRTLETKMVEPLYEAAHTIYIWSAAYTREHWGYWPFAKNNPYLFEMPIEECFDIDYPWQFELAEAMYKQRFGAGARR